MSLTRKTATIPTIIRVLILGCFMTGACAIAGHHGNPPAPERGTIEWIDGDKHLLLVKFHEHGNFRLLWWGAWTSFLKDGKIASASALTLGEAEIVYVVPFFGKPTLEKIIWQGNPKTRAH